MISRIFQFPDLKLKFTRMDIPVSNFQYDEDCSVLVEQEPDISSVLFAWRKSKRTATLNELASIQFISPSSNNQHSSSGDLSEKTGQQW